MRTTTALLLAAVAVVGGVIVYEVMRPEPAQKPAARPPASPAPGDILGAIGRLGSLPHGQGQALGLDGGASPTSDSGSLAEAFKDAGDGTYRLIYDKVNLVTSELGRHRGDLYGEWRQDGKVGRFDGWTGNNQGMDAASALYDHAAKGLAIALTPADAAAIIGKKDGHIQLVAGADAASLLAAGASYLIAWPPSV